MVKASPAHLRRVALRRQGLTGRRKLGGGLDGSRRALEQLGYVQIDTISVVARAHHHTLWARVGGYRDDHLNRLVARGDAFEYWHHAAAYLPMRDYRFALPRMRSFARGEERWMRSRDTALMRRVLERVRAEGPLRARDFEDTRSGTAGWWDWKPAKRALEQLFMQGELMSVGRDGFEKRYDVTERVLPPDVDTSEPSVDELAAHLVDGTLRAHGFASAKSFTYGRPGAPLRAAVKRALAAGIARGRVKTAELNGEVVFGEAGVFDERPRVSAPVVRILSPFDNSIIQRERGNRVFGFDYQIECYVTEAKRRYGYYCLPILFGEQFVGRMDCKAHREDGRFEIKHLHLDAPVTEAFLESFADTVRDYADYQNCATVTVARILPTRAAPAVRALFDG